MNIDCGEQRYEGEIWEDVLNKFEVDIEGGRLIWKNPPKQHKGLKGKEAGTVRGGVACAIRANKQWYRRTQLIFYAANNRRPHDDCYLYHKNGDVADDRISNIVEAKKADRKYQPTTKAKRVISPMEQHGSLFFLRHTEEKGEENRFQSQWQCSCGGTSILVTGRVLSGQRTCCKACSSRNVAASATTHGMKYTKEYSTWAGMKQRTLNKKAKDFSRYGAKGVSIFSEWADSFETFFSHIGLAPTKNHQVDRIDNEKGYEPGNVRWALPAEQSINKNTSRFWVINGKEFASIAYAAAHFGVSPTTIMRWCYGYLDPRRRAGRYTLPKSGCYSKLKYTEKECE